MPDDQMNKLSDQLPTCVVYSLLITLTYTKQDTDKTKTELITEIYV